MAEPVDDDERRELEEARRVVDEMIREGRSEGSVVLGGELTSEEPEPDPPSAERIRHRTIVVAAVAARSLNEVEGTYLDEARSALLDWVEGTGAAVELEPREAELLTAAPGGIDQTDLLNGSWQTEGALVLAWANGLMELPGPAEIAMPADVFGAIGLADPTLTSSAFDLASPRSEAEIEACRQRLLTIHWRVTEFSLRPGPLDLAAAVESHGWGPLTVDGVPLIDGDLALGSHAISDAPEATVLGARSIAVERHRAINWLTAGGSWEDTDVST